MLITREYYFEDRRDEFTGEKIDNSYLFEGLNIKAEGEKYSLVINISKLSIKGLYTLIHKPFIYLSLT